MWRAGIPPTVRGQVWQTAIGNGLQLSRAEYLRLCELNSRKHLAHSPGLGQSPSKLIEIDVPRCVVSVQARLFLIWQAEPSQRRVYLRKRGRSTRS